MAYEIFGQYSSEKLQSRGRLCSPIVRGNKQVWKKGLEGGGNKIARDGQTRKDGAVDR